MIPFNRPPVLGTEIELIQDAIHSNKLCGDGYFSHQCQNWFEDKTGCSKALLTPSCTHALELAALLIDIQPGDEVIMPSYTFVSTANAFVLRGARIVFVDIRPDTMNIDESKIEQAITNKTKAIVPVHYAGVSCEMDTIMNIANKYELWVIEDAAQGVMSEYKNRPLGTIGHLAAYSFHETKNYTSGGEGGLLLINDDQFIERAEIIREKGTNRSQFFQGMVDKYTWVDLGSSLLPSEIQAAYLLTQLNQADKINEKRLRDWSNYYDKLFPYCKSHGIELPSIPKNCLHNAHMFYLKVNDLEQRKWFISKIKEKGIICSFHYIPLHTSPGGRKFGVFSDTDTYTTRESERLVRLPMFYNMTNIEQERIIAAVKDILSMVDV